MTTAVFVGPRNPAAPTGDVEHLSPNVARQAYSDGTVYEISTNTGEPFDAIISASAYIPEADRKKAQWLSAFDEDGIYLTLWVAN